MSTQSPPVVIIGMHRSGTSLLAHLLHTCGVFMGARRNNHDEAYFFFHQNRRIYRLAHAYWDHPAPLHYLLDCTDVCAALVAELRRVLASHKAISYLGWWRYLRLRSVQHIDHPWGWKEPRTSFTLPLWLELFPNARLIHLSRHGVDVAGSLYRRERTRKKRMRNRLFSTRCLTLEGAFSLWAEYEEMCLSVADLLPPERVFRLRYEDFIAEPSLHLEAIADFLKLSFAPETVTRSVAHVDPGRAFAFRQDPELSQFFRERRDHPLLQRLDYDQL